MRTIGTRTKTGVGTITGDGVAANSASASGSGADLFGNCGPWPTTATIGGGGRAAVTGATALAGTAGSFGWPLLMSASRIGSLSPSRCSFMISAGDMVNSVWSRSMRARMTCSETLLFESVTISSIVTADAVVGMEPRTTSINRNGRTVKAVH